MSRGIRSVLGFFIAFLFIWSTDLVEARCGDDNHTLVYLQCVRWMPYSAVVEQQIFLPDSGVKAPVSRSSVMQPHPNELDKVNMSITASTGEMISQFKFDFVDSQSHKDKIRSGLIASNVNDEEGVAEGGGAALPSASKGHRKNLKKKAAPSTSKIAGDDEAGANAKPGLTEKRILRYQKDVTNKCHLEWLPECRWYDGLDRVIFLGDSTIMRDYMHIINSTDGQYIRKVAKLQTGTMEGRLHLNDGRVIEIYFFRLLHLSLALPIVDEAFKVATRNSLMVLTIGPHDTSWLVFRKPMPGQKKWTVGRWEEAKTYWRRHTSALSRRIGSHLASFDDPMPGDDDNMESNTGGGGARPERSRPTVANRKKRPFFIVREQFLANCAHPKYSKYPLITCCKTMLMPFVIPYYRAYTQAIFGAFGIPVVSVDPLMGPNPFKQRKKGERKPTQAELNSNKIEEGGTGDPNFKLLLRPCFLMDAGHVNRWPCKHAEIGMLFLAYRRGRDAGIVQGPIAGKCGSNAYERWDHLTPHHFGEIADLFEEFPNSTLEIDPLKTSGRWQEADNEVIKYISGLEGDLVPAESRRVIVNSTSAAVGAGVTARQQKEEEEPDDPLHFEKGEGALDVAATTKVEKSAEEEAMISTKGTGGGAAATSAPSANRIKSEELADQQGSQRVWYGSALLDGPTVLAVVLLLFILGFGIKVTMLASGLKSRASRPS